VKDALSSVLIAAGFTISPRTDQSDEGVVVILDWDDYEHPEALLRYQQNGAKIVVLASDLNRREPDDDQIAALVSLVALINAANRLAVIVHQRGGSYEAGMFAAAAN